MPIIERESACRKIDYGESALLKGGKARDDVGGGGVGHVVVRHGWPMPIKIREMNFEGTGENLMSFALRPDIFSGHSQNGGGHSNSEVAGLLHNDPGAWPLGAGQPHLPAFPPADSAVHDNWRSTFCGQRTH